jgi:hypothetical protein
VGVDVDNLEGLGTASAVLGELGVDPGAIAVRSQRQKERANAAPGESRVAA